MKKGFMTFIMLGLMLLTLAMQVQAYEIADDSGMHPGVQYTLREGETVTMIINQAVEVTLVYVSDPCASNCPVPNAKLVVAGELTAALSEGKEERLDNGLIVRVDDILVNSREGVATFTIRGTYGGTSPPLTEEPIITGEHSLIEGETTTVRMGGIDYEISLVYVIDCTDPYCAGREAKFAVNGHVTDALSEGETDTLENGIVITARSIYAKAREGIVGFDLDYFAPPRPDDKYVLSEGETKTYTINGLDYEVTLIFVSDPCTSNCPAPTAKFNVNGFVSYALTESGSHLFPGGLKLTVKELNNQARIGWTTFDLQASETVQEPPVSIWENDYIIVVGETSPVEDVLDAVALNAKLLSYSEQQRSIGAAGKSMIDTEAYKSATRLGTDFSENLVIVIHKKHVLLIIGDRLSESQRQILTVAKQHLELNGFIYQTMGGSEDAVKYLLTEKMITLFDGEETCYYNGKWHDEDDRFMIDCNTCGCGDNGAIICTQLECEVAEKCFEQKTPALEPVSGRCKIFETTCLPIGWARVDACSDDPTDDVIPSIEEPVVMPPVVDPKLGACDDGCLRGGRCLPYGTRMANGDAVYCSILGSFEEQQLDGASCQNSYECASNQCLNSECKSLDKQIEENTGLLKRIISWFGGIFG